MSRRFDPRPWIRAHAWVKQVAITVICCWLTGFVVMNFASTAPGRYLTYVFPRVGAGNSLDTQSIDRAWAAIQSDYFVRGVPGSGDAQGLDGTAAAEQAFVNFLSQKYGDKFSHFFTKQAYAEFTQGLAGERSGAIGITLEARCSGEKICPSNQTPTEAVIEEVLTGQPADKAGLKNGDVIVSVDGKMLSSLAKNASDQIDAAAPLIRGQAGTQVTLVISRNGQDVTFKITRQDLQISSVWTKKFGSVLYMEVTGFDSDTGDLAKKALKDNLDSSVTSIVLDLRGNPGGYVSAAQDLVSQFLKPGPNEQDVVVRRGRMDSVSDPSSAQEVTHDQISAGGLATTQKLVVLVDGGTASAAEITTMALRDYHRATLVGQKTFGKGSVQVDFQLPDGNDLHLTVEKWYGPDGESIDGTGINPDVAVKMDNSDNEFRLDAQSVDPSLDAQLQKALEIANG